MWGYSILRRKKKTFVVISQNGSCDFSKEGYDYINNLLGTMENLCEGVYCLPPEVNVESILSDAGFTKDEYRSKTVLDYMKERGSLR